MLRAAFQEQCVMVFWLFFFFCGGGFFALGFELKASRFLSKVLST
jgi:hypothetical protein